MKTLATLALCLSSAALAQTTVWNPGTGYYVSDGGNTPPGQVYPLVMGSGSQSLGAVTAPQFLYGAANSPISIQNLGDFDSMVAKSVSDRSFQFICSPGGTNQGVTGEVGPATLGGLIQDAIDSNPRNLSSPAAYVARAGVPPGVTSMTMNVNMAAGTGQTGNTVFGFFSPVFGSLACNGPISNQYQAVTPPAALATYSQTVAVSANSLVFPGLTFNQPAWGSSASGGHPIIGNVQLKPTGGTGVFAKDFFRVGASATTLWYNTRDENFYYDYEFRESPASEMVVDTDATSMSIELEDDDTTAPGPNGATVVFVNGKPLGTYYSTAGAGAYYSQFFNITLPAGMKRVEVETGAAGDTQQGFTQNNNRRGNYLQAIYLPAASTSYVIPPPAPSGRQVVIYGDSIAQGYYSDFTLEQGWFQLLRRWMAAQFVFEGWSGRSLYWDVQANSATAGLTYNVQSMQAVVNQIAYAHPTDIYFQLGVNDYLQSYWNAANFGLAYAAMLDALHARMPTAQIWAQNISWTQLETTANTQGSTIQNYRTQQTNACLARSWCFQIAGQNMFPSSCLKDSVHPYGDCEITYAQNVMGILEGTPPVASSPLAWSGISSGTCSIAAGTTCTATTQGSTTASACQVSIQGATSQSFSCSCNPGAGTTVVTCPAATTATLNVITIH